LQSYSGYIHHPTYPKFAKNNLNCIWTIAAPAGKNIFLDFKYFKFELSNGCQNDYIEVYDGNDDSAPLIGRFCGNEIPKSVTSTGNYISVVMVTNDETQSRGYIALYKQVGSDKTTVGPTGKNYFLYKYEIEDRVQNHLAVTQHQITLAHSINFDYIEHSLE